ncbi:surfeit locus protein 6-domain-containing protein [Tricharina praecox]|uniref:surfeit locus protein 6-domain-containing protein n=1 Tax=Tricharina praecox TaxID=43433 RepID=UPI00221ED35C|nr:surfeit locus protein 6-domain-containing protein [Tricharina praecox]KAI5854579.1 surfeit locus protein 6-domain-containing protein [Tricharina praecox]
MADIEQRLKSHSTAFEGLLSLIPGNKYFEGDNTAQWSKRKQSKEEHKRAKKAKLDPDSVTTAAEFRAKRQRGEDDVGDNMSGDEAGEEAAEVEEAPPKPKKSKKQQQQTPKKAAAAKEKAVDEKEVKTPAQKKGKGKASVVAVGVAPPSEEVPTATATSNDDDEDEDSEMIDASEPIQINGFADLAESPSTITTEDQPTPATTTPTEPRKPELDAAARAEQRARLAARIEALRAKRKADNADGTSARTRQDLLEARRKKEAQRKERKKAARLADKIVSEGEDVLSEIPAIPAAAAATPAIRKDFSFGRVTFDDGRQLNAKLQDFQKDKRRRGPTDLLGQLKHTEAKKRRIEQMGDEKKEEVLEKEKWSKALKQATGEKIKDDEKLLKKALKRQESQKRKSAHEWGERLSGQSKSQAQRVKKREENLQARIDSKKANKGGKKITKKSQKPFVKKGGKKPSRPGFEGGMKSSSGKGKSKGKK